MLTTFDHPTTGKTYRVFDGKGGVPGFCVKITKDGFKTAYVLLATGEKKIGSPPVWTIARARKEAMRLRALVDTGHNPQAELEAARREAAEAREAPDVKKLVTRYIEDELEKLRASTREEYSALLKIIVAKLGNKKVRDVSHSDIDAMHRSMRGTPYRANKLAAVASRIFNLAKKWGWIEKNPAEGIERNPEEGREMYLSEVQLGSLLSACDDYSDQQIANAVRLLLLSGARRSEVLSATWGQFDLAAATWTKPGSHTKQKRTSHVTLSVEAVELLMAIGEGKPGEFLFPSHGASGHLVEIKKGWRSICQAAGISGVRIHDLRHSAASFALNAGESLSTIGRMLGHASVTTTQRYSHVSDHAQRRAANAVGSIYRNAKTKRGKVVKFPGA